MNNNSLPRSNVPTINPKKGYFYYTNFIKNTKSLDKTQATTRVSTATTYTSRMVTDKSMASRIVTDKSMQEKTMKTKKTLKNQSADYQWQTQPCENICSQVITEQSIQIGTFGSISEFEPKFKRPFTALSLRHVPSSRPQTGTSKNKYLMMSLKQTDTKKKKNDETTENQNLKARKMIKKMEGIANVKSLLSFSQKIRIRIVRLRLNKSDHVIGYSFLKSMLAENMEDELEKKIYCLEKNKAHILELLEIKQILLSHESMIEEPLVFFQSLENVVNKFKEGTFLHVYGLFLKGRVFFSYEDYHRSLACMKGLEIVTAKDCYDEFKLFSCFHQGKNYLCLKDFKEALKYFFKSLQIAWMLNDKNQELLIYDELGLVYYYLGDLETAKLFHEKMTLGKVEKEKEFKEYSINLYKTGVKNSLIQKKVDKTFKKAFLSHLFNHVHSYDKAVKPRDHELNIEMKRLELEGKIRIPEHEVGAFLYKNEDIFKKREERRRRLGILQKNSDLSEKRILTHQSYNRNHQNFGIFGGNIDKFQKVSYKSNKSNQRAVAKMIKRILAEINNGLVDLEDFAGVLEKEI